MRYVHLAEHFPLANQPTLQASADSDRQVSADHKGGWQALGDIYDDDGVLTSLTLSGVLTYPMTQITCVPLAQVTESR